MRQGVTGALYLQDWVRLAAIFNVSTTLFNQKNDKARKPCIKCLKNVYMENIQHLFQMQEKKVSVKYKQNGKKRAKSIK